ncbi:MAG TPA: 50S ribosomal protein L21 [Clostridiales bacterium]|nr:50S ribosomal protein L21 [Clostridiales bacterium]
MYAIIKTGGKQYRVQEGDILRIEKLKASEGETVIFDEVLAINNDEGMTIGTPYVENASVEGNVTAQGKGKKIIVYKYKPKKNYRKKQGHRQPFTEVQITKING